MISRLEIANFKCLRDVKLDLGPLTVLIGPNDSGKSSILDAVYVVGKSTHSPLREALHSDKEQRATTLPLESIVWQRDRELDVKWRIEGTTSAGIPFVYALAIPATWPKSLSWPPDRRKFPRERLDIDGEEALQVSDDGMQARIGTLSLAINQDNTYLHQVRQSRLPEAAAVTAALASTEKYRLDPDALRRPHAPSVNPILDNTGSNLAAVLDALFGGPDASARIELEKVLHASIPTLRGISLVTDQNREKSLEFSLNNESRAHVPIPASNASDGALLLTAFLALAYGQTPEILLIEEPENGLHPSRMKLVVELLRKMSRGEVGNQPRQVIITTHSPILLNYVSPDEVRIVTRDPKTGTQVFPMKEVRDLDKLTDEFAVGEMWYLLGEEGLLKSPQQ